MQSDYHLQDLVFQDGNGVVYRAHDQEGSTYAIVRLKLPAETIPILAEGSFHRALEELMALDHFCLRPVVDGGLDPVDGYPWVAVRWWPGPHLGERIADGPLSDPEINRLQGYAQSLIEFLGARAGAISFNPDEIITTESTDGQPVETFVINYWTWFNDRAESRLPGTGTSAPRALRRLVDSLRPLEELPPESPPATQAAITPEPLAHPGTPIPSAKTTLLVPIITVITLLSLVGGGAWLVLQRRPPAIAENQQETSAPQDHRKPRPAVASRSISPAEPFFTAADEARLRGMIGETVTVRAKVADDPHSQNGNTFYLLLNEDGPGFRAGVRIHDVEDDLDEPYLEQFVGETVMISGELQTEKSADNTKEGLVIFFDRKNNLQRIRE
ncbi:hypothetical protein V2O64_13635 [Verrucomicrobiaceae bacterium 227]